MAKKRIVSRPGLFGTEYHYDERGRFVGKSRPGLLGGTRVYTDSSGRWAGVSRPGLFGTQVYTDREGHTVSARPGLFGWILRSGGETVGRTRPGFFGTTCTEWEADEKGSFPEGEYLDEDDLFFL